VDAGPIYEGKQLAIGRKAKLFRSDHNSVGFNGPTVQSVETCEVSPFPCSSSSSSRSTKGTGGFNATNDVESLLDGAHVARKGNNVVNVGGDGLMEMYPEKMGSP
jgi:hypothetical protein